MSSVDTRLRTELPVMKDEPGTEGEAEEPKPPPPPRSTQKRMLPSLSAPEHAFPNKLLACEFTGRDTFGAGPVFVFWASLFLVAYAR
ncbi:uncharacterized protein A4U43_C08F1270 [Asparagus officinalis]|nr:uncharacterized protein A4U43_C08F1270 [Asparagus officinalis]